jgi:hypothetical protein
VEKIRTSLAEVGAVSCFVGGLVLGAVADARVEGLDEGATDVDSAGETAVGETPTSPEAAGVAEAAGLEDVPATAVTDCANEQSSRGTGV